MGWLGIYFNIHEADAEQQSFGSVPLSIGPQLVVHNISLHLWFRKDEMSLQVVFKNARSYKDMGGRTHGHEWLEVAGVWIIMIPMGDRLFIRTPILGHKYLIRSRVLYYECGRLRSGT